MVAKTSLTSRQLRPVEHDLRRANALLARRYRRDASARQPVHTMCGGAHLFNAGTPHRMGVLAREALDTYAPDGATFARILGLAGGASGAAGWAQNLRTRVVAKLHREPIEDFRIDFEDGYGDRSDTEEDGHARSAAEEVVAAHTAGRLPPFVGLRIKPMSTETYRRGLRTLDIFVTTLTRAAGGSPPSAVRVTVPKVMSPSHVSAAARACRALEGRLGLPTSTLQLEVMVEMPQAIFAADGSLALRSLVEAGRGRVIGAHFGAYDYTASCGVVGAEQGMRHVACDVARHVIQAALAQTGVQLSDGATNVLPVALHRPGADRVLTVGERSENAQAVHHAWKLHFDDITHSLVNGYYQGWDIHPSQLPTRYAAVYTFFQSARPNATARLRNLVEREAHATRVGAIFDDAATGQGLVNFFLRGLHAGALTEDEVAETGLTRQELDDRSFVGSVRRHSRRR